MMIVLCPETTRGVVYKITLPDGKAYIGKSERTARKRLRGHFRDKSAKFHEALKDLSPDDCKLEVLFHSNDPAELFEVEKQMIAEHRTQDPAVGYNTGAGGEGLTSARAKTLAEDPTWLAKNAEANRKRAEDPKFRAKHAETNRTVVAAANRVTSGIAPLDGVVTVLADRNPRRPGPRHLAFSLYRTGQTVAEFLEACRPHGLLEPTSPGQNGTLAGSALRHDVKDRYIRIDAPAAVPRSR